MTTPNRKRARLIEKLEALDDCSEVVIHAARRGIIDEEPAFSVRRETLIDLLREGPVLDGQIGHIFYDGVSE